MRERRERRTKKEGWKEREGGVKGGEVNTKFVGAMCFSKQSKACLHQCAVTQGSTRGRLEEGKMQVSLDLA